MEAGARQSRLRRVDAVLGERPGMIGAVSPGCGRVSHGRVGDGRRAVVSVDDGRRQGSVSVLRVAVVP